MALNKEYLILMSYPFYKHGMLHHDYVALAFNLLQAYTEDKVAKNYIQWQAVEIGSYAHQNKFSENKYALLWSGRNKYWVEE